MHSFSFKKCKQRRVRFTIPGRMEAVASQAACQNVSLCPGLRELAELNLSVYRGFRDSRVREQVNALCTEIFLLGRATHRGWPRTLHPGIYHSSFTACWIQTCTAWQALQRIQGEDSTDSTDHLAAGLQ